MNSFPKSQREKKSRSPGVEVAYIFLIEGSQPPNYCFHRFIKVQYSYDSHFLKIFQARGATWFSLGMMGHFGQLDEQAT